MEQEQTQDQDLSNLISIYITQLSASEQVALQIAREHLGTSFHIQKSNGFIQWLKTNA